MGQAIVSQNFQTVLTSVIEVFGVVAIAWLYARRLRPEFGATLKLGMHIFLPCLGFASFIDSRFDARALMAVWVASIIQIGSGLLIGFFGLRWAGLRERRELLLPIAFVNSANLPFPLLLANFGPEGLALGVLSYTVTNLAIFTAGIMILHGGGRMREALKEPVLWATIAAVLLRALHIQPPETLMRIPRLAGSAAVPVMLFLFGDSLARARLTSIGPASLATFLRYASGAVGLAATLFLLHPEGLLRKVLVLYALLPSAMVNVVLAQRAGRDPETVSSVVVLTTLAGIIILPLLLAFVR
jgi:malate permease and related proteins